MEQDEAEKIATDAVDHYGNEDERNRAKHRRVLTARITAYGEQCRRAGAEAMQKAAALATADAYYGDIPTEAERDILEAAIATIRSLPLPPSAEAASPAAGWLTKATAPRDGTRVLGCITGFQPLCAIFLDGRWEDDAGTYYPITHWMPLPTSPSEEARAG